MGLFFPAQPHPGNAELLGKICETLSTGQELGIAYPGNGGGLGCVEKEIICDFRACVTPQSQCLLLAKMMITMFT